MRRNVLKAIAFAAALPALSAVPHPAWSQEAYPSRPVRVIIGFGPGSGTDIIARMLGDELREVFNQAFIVDNRPGASAQIAATAVAKAPADGYTLLLTSNSSHSVNPHVVKNLPYDPIADFTPIGGIGYFPFILAVDAKLPVTTPRELVTWARGNKGKVNYAYGTITVQIPAEALNRLEGLGAVGVPYKSSPAAMLDVIGGQASFIVVDLASSQPHLKSGRLRALAVTSASRTSLAPELPTVEESLGLRDFDLAAWTGLFGPKGLPANVVERLSTSMQQILAKPEMRKRMLAAGIEPTPSNPAAFAAMVKQQLEVWGRNVKHAGIEAQ